MIEKILIEINRLKNELDGYSAREALDYIESYINSLPEPQLPADKLEKRLDEINKRGLENAHTIDFSKEYENSKKILRKAKLPSDVEEAAREYHERIQFSSKPSFYDAFIAGAEWAMGQGETYNGKVLEVNSDSYLFTHFGDNFFDMGDKTRIKGTFMEGDVTVQIRKKEEQK